MIHQTQIEKNKNPEYNLAFYYRVPLLCAAIFCYIFIECASKQFLVKSKSKFILVNTKSGNSSRTKYGNLNGIEKETGLGQKNPTNQLMNNDYSDLVTKQRNLNSKRREDRRSFRKRKNYPKNRFINNQFKEFGNDYYSDWHNKILNQRKHRQRKKNSKNSSINQSIVINQSTNSNGWLSKYNSHIIKTCKIIFLLHFSLHFQSLPPHQKSI